MSGVPLKVSGSENHYQAAEAAAAFPVLARYLPYPTPKFTLGEKRFLLPLSNATETHCSLGRRSVF